MKQVFYILLFCTSFTVKAQVFTSQNINLLSRWQAIGESTNSWNKNLYAGVYGWYDTVKNREYAIVGGASGYYFVDVTNKNNPVLCDSVKGNYANAVWRESTTYQHYAYLTSDDANNNFYTVDLQYLPDSVQVISRKHSTIERSHSLFVNNDKLYLGIESHHNGTTLSNKTMSVYSLANPANPTYLRCIEDDYPNNTNNVHDMYVRNDTVYASSSYGGLYIYKYNVTLNKFEIISSLTAYNGAGYNHSSALTPNSQKLVMCDEVPAALPIKIIDVSNPLSPVVDTTFNNNNSGATPHNPYLISNTYLVMSYYRDGIVVYDISDSKHPIRTGYYDSFPDSINCNYCGSWGNYPFLPSGIVLNLDMKYGLFVLDISAAITNLKKTKNDFANKVVLSPNPTTNEVNINVLNAQVTIHNMYGSVVKSITNTGLAISINDLANGVYTVLITTQNNTAIKRLIKQ
ncbi:MAG: choice-of-anchor B family protein [Bacteroidia bacterium]|nr:choice-of-anchor B family protein [Bacteroidia bacterium]